ncbi:hypothetical protein AKJ09_04638 [Labilithrix luteola]|uniref:Uncharacterized protein n=1 Tax=Labilithrix luteola TaxID=1391654 RepID=A0A0K1PXV0_9BACT|nr:hypothetical protein AKJ09_04638 [Labilithrix luteola]
MHSEEANEELAQFYSLVVSCDRLEENPPEYLADRPPSNR